MTEDLFRQVEQYLPRYLNPQQKRDLYSELSKFPDQGNYYVPVGSVEAELLQGDGWRGFIALNFESGERKEVSGIVLSNSCDVDPVNERRLSPQILFSPLIKLEAYVRLLSEAGETQEQIESHSNSIRAQRVTNIFFLPDGPYGLTDDNMVLLDNVHAHPSEDFLARERSCLFRLSQFGFYLLLVKLSIHFTRMQEEVPRFPPAT